MTRFNKKNNNNGHEPWYRELHEGMGQAVAERTILRKLSLNDGRVLSNEEAEKEPWRWETWGDVAERVALGNSLLEPREDLRENEYQLLRKHIGNATTIMSGRHLQHGDSTQPSRGIECFTNCATAATSFSLFLLLLHGSGVGRCYDEDMMLVNWDNAPTLRCVLDESHPDFDYSAHESVRDAKHKYCEGRQGRIKRGVLPEAFGELVEYGRDVLWYTLPDTREGWAKALEIWENAAFEKVHKDKMLILDFSGVRSKGSPIKGMQSRPASGPVPLMNAFMKAATIKGSNIPRWKQAMYVDHYFAECVLVGGARRSARMSTKTWRDMDVLEFITIKRPIEYIDKQWQEIIEFRESQPVAPFSFLWSSNNSVTVDEEFWELLGIKKNQDGYMSELAQHARRVFRAITEASYADGTGEPAMLNAHKFTQNNIGLDDLEENGWIGSQRYQVNEDTEILMQRLVRKVKRKKYKYIVNPCGEIILLILGGYCTLGDVVPFHADTLEEAEEAFRATTRALIRTNLMDSLYHREVKRTNRIGVGITGIHEFAWKFFELGFRDLVDEEKSKDFWLALSRFHHAVRDEAERYSRELGVVMPHTAVTVKPSGTVSKLFGLTEGWHLPSMAWYLRWVQFRYDDPLVEVYKAKGYPTRELKSYEGTIIVGFPTAPKIVELDLGDKLVTAGEATPEGQFKWLQLGEKYWLQGFDGNAYPKLDLSNNISYTLKYSPEKVDFHDFRAMIKEYQPTVKCCSVMPQTEATSYEYQPEEPLVKAQYEKLIRAIKEQLAEDVDKVHIHCESGSCPIDFNEDKKSQLSEDIHEVHIECSTGAVLPYSEK